MYLLIIYL